MAEAAFPTPPTGEPPASPAGGWSVGAGRGATWWSDGWHLFRAAPGMWILLVVVFAALCMATSFIPVVAQIAGLVYPVLATGLVIGARDLDRGEPLRFAHLFACFNERAWPIVGVTLLYILGWFVASLIALGICAMVFGLSTLSAAAKMDFSNAPFDLIATLGVAALLAMLIVLLLVTPVIMAYWFAPTLIALRGDRPVAAMKASFQASLRNMPPLLIYGLILIALAIAATIPFGLGWLALGPMFFTSVYASYRDIFGSPGIRGQESGISNTARIAN